jgi:hypothetical protein
MLKHVLLLVLLQVAAIAGRPTAQQAAGNVCAQVSTGAAAPV